MTRRWRQWLGEKGLGGPVQTRAKWHDSAALGLVFVGLLTAGSGVAVLFLHHLPPMLAIALLADGVPVVCLGFAYHRSLIASAAAEAPRPTRSCPACRSTGVGAADVRCPTCGATLR